MTVIYHKDSIDLRHSCAGIYVDIGGCFELPVGPFTSRDLARTWLTQNAERLIELYGSDAVKEAQSP